ncbi:hypothetical protein P3S68_009867 [Capsicum galapagoense]
MSSVDFEEAGHKLLKINIEPGQEMEICIMLLESILPKDNPKNTRFAINFFTSIGIGGITENLREYLKNTSRHIMKEQKPVSLGPESESESSDSERDDHRRKRRRRT